ncbi:MAG: hypothetical protein P1U81_02245 [Verrucomicrobiales bacterium]|nr:hypothetical protein [Verrucomicrobiales bacterium]
MSPAFSRLSVFSFLFAFALTAHAEPGISVADYDSIQAALDANPNRILFVPAETISSLKSCGSAGKEPAFSAPAASFRPIRITLTSKSRMPMPPKSATSP